MLTVIHGGRVFAPRDLGVKDILIAGEQIAAIADTIDPPADWNIHRVDATDCRVTPGLIDLHVHLLGGAGIGGPSARVAEIPLSELIQAGVTTVLGLLGSDDISRTPEALLLKALGLIQEGISAYILSGSYNFPPVATITGSLRKDLSLLPQVIGVGEIAIADHRSAQASFEDFVHVVAEAHMGGLLGGKAGLVQVHLGEGHHGMDYLFRLASETDIPIDQVLPTHIERSPEVLRQSVAFAQAGGHLDITVTDRRLPLTRVLQTLLEAGVDLEQLTMSTDAGSPMSQYDQGGNFTGMGMALSAFLPRTLAELVQAGFAPSDVLSMMTRNPARRMHIEDRKGSLEVGKDADMVLFDDAWQVERVFARGRLMVSGGRAMAKASYA